MNHIPQNCYSKHSRKSNLNEAQMLSMHSAIDHDVHPMDIANCEVTPDNTPMIHSFFVCKLLTKVVALSLDIQMIY